MAATAATASSCAWQALPSQYAKAVALNSRRCRYHLCCCCCWTAATADAGHCLAAQRGAHGQVQDINAAARLLLLLLLAVWLQVVEAVEVQGDTVLLLGVESPGCQGLLQAHAVLERLNCLRLCRKGAKREGIERSNCSAGVNRLCC